ncbi:MAG: ABC transporter ATP-binding protein [Candidatus Sericytochromatia bacterium]
MSNLIVKATNLTKKYDNSSLALNNLNINVPEGSVYGLLGQNGAGKSTLIRIIMSLLKPNTGEIKVLGCNPLEMNKKLKEQIGYSSDSMQLIPWLKVSEMLNYNGSFYDNWDLNYVEQWVKKLELPLNKRVFSLSRGTRQKLALIMAIGHRPKLLVLDEPAGGLDPLARKDFLESMIELINESGTSVIISSHLLTDLEKIADNIGIIVKGEMKIETDLETLKNTTKKVRIATKKDLVDIKIKDALKISTSNNTLNITFKNWNNDKITELKQMFPESLIDITHLSLEDIFLAYT